jgi:hypothetical protein
VTESNAEDAVRSATQRVSPVEDTNRSQQTEIQSIRTFPKQVDRSAWVEKTSHFNKWHQLDHRTNEYGRPIVLHSNKN